MTTLLDFFVQVAKRERWPVSEGYLQAGCVVQMGEGSQARFNPIDTILWLPGATAYNTFGPNGRYHVWNYPDLATGVEATARTWAAWPGVVDAIRAEASCATIIAEIDQVAEGSPTSYYAQFVPQVLASWPQAAGIIVAGSSPAPTRKVPEMMFRNPHNGNIYASVGAALVHLDPPTFAQFQSAGVPLVESVSDQFLIDVGLAV